MSTNVARSVITAFSSLLITSVALAVEPVTVTQSPAAVATKAFNPDSPPRDMPPLHPGEAAVTESRYSCGVQVEVEITPDAANPTMKVTGIRANLKLDVDMWLPVTTTQKIRDHESGHKDIALAFYKGGDEGAKTIAARYIGKTVKLKSTDSNETKPQIQKIADEFCGEYLGGTEVRSQKVQERYDQLTDHGRNKLPEKKAIEQAMKAAG